MAYYFKISFKGRSLWLFLLFFFLSFSVFSQVGFNNPNPDSSALIDMKANDKGLLIPRMKTTDRELMAVGGKKVAHALMVFDTDQNVFFVYDTISDPDRWSVLNPFYSPSNVNGNIGISTTSAPTEKLEVNGSVKADKFIGNGTIPIGGIILWSGNIFSIPQGWSLCDGTNNTPDLRQRFVVGAGGNNPTVAGGGYGNGVVGGSDFVTLSANQSGLPSHTHIINDPGHKHSINDPGHLHNFPTSAGKGGNGEVSRLRDPVDQYNNTSTSTTGITVLSSATGISIQSVPSQNAVEAFDNRPPFYALAYIMRIQ